MRDRGRFFAPAFSAWMTSCCLTPHCICIFGLIHRIHPPQEIEYLGDDELLQRYRTEMQVSNDQVGTEGTCLDPMPI